MNISIIIPVYNEMKAIGRCLDAILSQDYPKEDCEVIVVNDGSNDGTREVVERYPIKLINLDKNEGRIVAREAGVRSAKYDMLLFVDSRYIIQGNDFLKRIAGIGYQPLFPIAIEKKYGSPFNTLFYLMRKKWYKPYYPFDEYPKEFWINEENFDTVPKGMSVILIDKHSFLSSIPKEKGKLVNDDTRLLREIVKRKNILRCSDIKVAYLQRTGFWEVMKHIYERGPRFADFYLAKGGRYHCLYAVGLTFTLLFFLVGMLRPDIFMFVLWGLLSINTVGAAWLAEDVRDFFICFLLAPQVGMAFVLGILKWQVRLLYKRGWKRNWST